MKKEQLEEAVAKRKATIPALEAPIAPIAATPPVKKVAILGFTESWRLAPFDDESWEIWGLNELYITIPRWTRWFEIHDRAVYEADKKRVSDHVQRLMAMECPIYMQRHWDDIPGSVEYPLNALAQMFPNPTPGAKPYLTNTITYMILLAIAEGFQSIKLCGVNMSHDSEYAQQRPSCEWAVGLAQGRGINVWIPMESDLMKTNYLYGFEEEQANAFDAKLASRKKELQDRLNGLDAQMNNLNAAREQHRGALQDAEHLHKIWRSTPH